MTKTSADLVIGLLSMVVLVVAVTFCELEGSPQRSQGARVCPRSRVRSYSPSSQRMHFSNRQVLNITKVCGPSLKYIPFHQETHNCVPLDPDTEVALQISKNSPKGFTTLKTVLKSKNVDHDTHYSKYGKWTVLALVGTVAFSSGLLPTFVPPPKAPLIYSAS